MKRACGPPETLREKKGLKQNSNGKPNNWGTNLSQSNPRLHDHSARGVPWKFHPAKGFAKHRFVSMLPISSLTLKTFGLKQNSQGKLYESRVIRLRSNLSKLWRT